MNIRAKAQTGNWRRQELETVWEHQCRDSSSTTVSRGLEGSESDALFFERCARAGQGATA